MKFLTFVTLNCCRQSGFEFNPFFSICVVHLRFWIVSFILVVSTRYYAHTLWLVRPFLFNFVVLIRLLDIYFLIYYFSGRSDCQLLISYFHNERFQLLVMEISSYLKHITFSIMFHSTSSSFKSRWPLCSHNYYIKDPVYG